MEGRRLRKIKNLIVNLASEADQPELSKVTMVACIVSGRLAEQVLAGTIRSLTDNSVCARDIDFGGGRGEETGDSKVEEELEECNDALEEALGSP